MLGADRPYHVLVDVVSLPADVAFNRDKQCNKHSVVTTQQSISRTSHSSARNLHISFNITSFGFNDHKHIIFAHRRPANRQTQATYTVCQVSDTQMRVRKNPHTHTSVIFVTKIKTRTRIIGRRFQRTRTRIIVIQKTKTK